MGIRKYIDRQSVPAVSLLGIYGIAIWLCSLVPCILPGTQHVNVAEHLRISQATPGIFGAGVCSHCLVKNHVKSMGLHFAGLDMPAYAQAVVDQSPCEFDLFERLPHGRSPPAAA